MKVQSPLRASLNLTVISLALPLLLSSLGVSVANITLPQIQAHFHAGLSDTQWVVLTYLLMSTVMVIPSGYVGDLYGRRRVLLAGLLCFVASSVACAVTPTFGALVACRAIQGASAAILATLTMSLIRDHAVPGSLGSSLGLLGSMSAIGTALGPFLGGLLVGQFGWRSAFVILVPLAAASLVLAARLLPKQADESTAGNTKFDLAGILLLAATMALLTLAVAGGALLTPHARLLFAATGLLAGLFFVAAERRASFPIVKIDMFRTSSFCMSLAMNALVAALMMSTLVIGPYYLQSGLGLSTAQAGLVMSVGPAVSIICGLPAGLVTDHLGAQNTTVAGLGLVMLGTFGLAYLPVAMGTVGYLCAVAILTPGYQLFLAANNFSVMAGASKAERGTVSGILNLSRNIGLLAGTSVAGTVFSAVLGTWDGPITDARAVLGAASYTFSVAGAIILAVVCAAILRPIAAGRLANLAPESQSPGAQGSDRTS